MQYTIVIERAPKNYAATFLTFPVASPPETPEKTPYGNPTGDRLPHRELARTWGAGAETALYGDRCRHCRCRVTGLQLLGILENISHLGMVSCAGKDAVGCRDPHPTAHSDRLLPHRDPDATLGGRRSRFGQAAPSRFQDERLDGTALSRLCERPVSVSRSRCDVA